MKKALYADTGILKTAALDLAEGLGMQSGKITIKFSVPFETAKIYLSKEAIEIKEKQNAEN